MVHTIEEINLWIDVYEFGIGIRHLQLISIDVPASLVPTALCASHLTTPLWYFRETLFITYARIDKYVCNNTRVIIIIRSCVYVRMTPYYYVND